MSQNRDALRRRLGKDHRPARTVDRLQERLQDLVPLVHGVHLVIFFFKFFIIISGFELWVGFNEYKLTFLQVGFPPVVGQGSDLSRLPRDALLDRVHHSSSQL